MSTLLSESEIADGLVRLSNWKLSEDQTSISTSFELADFVAALDLVNRVGREAEQRNHHPDIDIRWNTVTLVLSTHSAGGLTAADLELAGRINEVADQPG
ncbi:MAG: 4a-hydroxytetrahydrobiopterin dehydratase [Microlunatus sp.]|nr:4a-hydroxytetrahydrobiopterin dehydratase [Microlunatus sp.]MDN5772018.1 4a-hydroxytetrahydrobiopterin dehydratase [Microlunatus sp.]MDN5804034.1 4a-hydroxytetrahydrobiopterin dehydratase [Microlunatus sp.]